MKLVSLCRTRRTCKRLDNFVEENRFSITRGIFENTNLRNSVSQDSFSVDACRRRDYEKIINPFSSFSAISFKNIIIQYLDFFDLDNVIEENKIRTKEKVFSLLQTLRLSCEVLQLSNMTEMDFLEFLSISNCKEVRVDFSEGNFDRVLEAIQLYKN